VNTVIEKATLTTVLALVNAATDHHSLVMAIDEIDRMFFADKQEIEMRDEDWFVLNKTIEASPHCKRSNMELFQSQQEANMGTEQTFSVTVNGIQGRPGNRLEDDP